MNGAYEPEVWLPDLVERCQDGLRYSWELEPDGECWYLSRSAIERFIQEDAAGNDLPDEWRKLLLIANAPAGAVADLPDWLHFNASDFETLNQWSQRLGDKLDLSPWTPALPAEPEVAIPVLEGKAGIPRAKNNFAFLVAIVLVPLIGLYVYMNNLLSMASVEQRSAQRRASEALTDLKAKASEADKERSGRLAALDKVDALSKQNALLLSAKTNQPAKTTDPKVSGDVQGIDLRYLAQSRNAGRTSGWDVRSPSFTAIVESPSTFIWEKGKKMAATIQVFDQATQRSVWSHVVNFADGKVDGVPKLSPGRFYVWSVVTESEDEGYSAIPFYVLSVSERVRLRKLTAAAKSDGERAAITAKFGLFEELGSLGMQAKRHYALD